MNLGDGLHNLGLQKPEPDRVSVWYGGPALLALAAIIYATVCPITERPHLAAPVIERFASYFGLGVLLARTFHKDVARALLSVSGVALILEAVQLLIPGRHGELVDALVKILGGVCGVGIGCRQLLPRKLMSQLRRRWCAHEWRKSRSKVGAKVCVKCRLCVFNDVGAAYGISRYMFSSPVYPRPFVNGVRGQYAGADYDANVRGSSIFIDLRGTKHIEINSTALPALVAAALKELQQKGDGAGIDHLYAQAAAAEARAAQAAAE